ncbi:MAG: gamma carbonic anhydrase family protein [Acidobacteria bacterium]|nr:MAG: gamma carbonic anhydrase family protein [Acidobacteriota bacterium]MCE7959854.1 gamma carbonic anhydrase family protein [Acidobacteria bacterium ACB2]
MIVRPYRGVAPRLGARVFLAETAAVIGDVVLGDDVSIWYSSVVRGDCCWIRIGDRANVQDNCTLHVTKGTGPLVLEEEVTVGHNAVLHACTVRRGALVGMNATILDGADVGASSLVAAAAVVLPRTVIPPGTLWAGSPARLKRDLTSAEVEGLTGYWKNYLEYKAAYLADDERSGRRPAPDTSLV